MISWELEADELVSCNCAYGCPCQFNALPTYGYCEAVAGIAIKRGRFGDVKLIATPSQHFSGRTLWDGDRTLWASWVIESGSERLFYSGDSGYFPGFKQIGDTFGGFDVALMENGAYDSYWPTVHMTPEETVRAFKDLRGGLLYVVHNSTFDLAFHTWQDPLERIAALAEREQLPLATAEIGEVLTLGKPRNNVLWWKGLR